MIQRKDKASLIGIEFTEHSESESLVIYNHFKEQPNRNTILHLNIAYG